MVGLNHGCWSYDATYDGGTRASSRWPPSGCRATGRCDGRARSRSSPSTMGAVPAEYFKYYYFRTRCWPSCGPSRPRAPRTSWPWAPGYWEHYREQPPRRAGPRSRPLARRHPRARAGDRRHGRRLQRQGRDPPVNVPNRGGVAARPARGPRGRGVRRAVDGWIEPLPAPPLPRHVLRADRDARRVPVARRRGGLVRATAATPSARWPRTRWCGRCRGPSGCTPSSPSRIARICPGGSRHEASRRRRLPGRPSRPRRAVLRPGQAPARRPRDRAGDGAAAARQRHDGADRLRVRAGTTPTCEGTELLRAALAEHGV